jgi:hypothetical protein
MVVLIFEVFSQDKAMQKKQKKRMKIPKRVIRTGSTDNTNVKEKRRKPQTMIHKTLRQKN